QKIVLQAGQSALTIEGQNISFACPGVFSVKGSQHAFEGAGGSPAMLEKLPDTRVKATSLEKWKMNRKFPVSR
ncbi:MAG: DUF2345 domain-containing protein, partial [Azonexus sp.]|nr:DUF2345 domain-containing protein [Azonexus sp.]